MLLSEMTFQQFLQNPTGPYSAFFGKRENIKIDLENRFSKLLSSTKNKEFKCEGFKSGNDYFFHIKIPSEKYSNILYDVVINLTPKQSYVLTEGTLLNYNLLFFSNSPAFVYTYVYISKKDKLLIPFMQNKINSTALTTPPSVKNPVQIYGFEKSIYFALLYLKYKNYHIKTAIPPEFKTKNVTHNVIYSRCKSSDMIMKEYNIEKHKEKLKKEKDKRLKQKKEIKDKNKLIKDSNKQRESSKKIKHNKIIRPKKKL